MDLAYNEFLKLRLEFLEDPVSHIKIRTNRLCYPISYVSPLMASEIENNDLRDTEIDQLLHCSLLKDLPNIDKLAQEHPLIADGAAHIWDNRVKEPFVLLLGMPKIGKSSLLRKLALVIIENWTMDRDIVPMLVNLNQLFIPDLVNNTDFIEACFSQHEEFEAYLREKFYMGKLAILLDNLEETSYFKEKISHCLTDIRKIVHLPLCVCTSRFQGYFSIPGSVCLKMELIPLKLQVSMAQEYLSESQYERFIELITTTHEGFSEVSTSPFLFSLVLDLFRWGRIELAKSLNKGQMTSLLLRHFLGTGNSQTLKALESISHELLCKESNYVTWVEAKQLDYSELWNSIKTCPLLILIDESKDNSSVEYITEDDFVTEKEENKGSPLSGAPVKCNDATPQWVGVSRESLLTYQIARSHIARESLTTEKLERFKFWNHSFQELLAGRYVCNSIENYLLHVPRTFSTESFSASRAFSQFFPVNYLYSRKYREVLIHFGCLCTETVFGSFIKYLLGSETLEKCHIVERLLKERGNYTMHKPLILKLTSVRQSLIKKEYPKNSIHPAEIVRKIGKAEALASGLDPCEMNTLKCLETAINQHWWLGLKYLFPFALDLGAKAVKLLVHALADATYKTLQTIDQEYSEYGQKQVQLLQLLLELFTNSDPLRVSTHNESLSARAKLVLLEKLGPIRKLTSLLLSTIHSCSAIDLNSTVKLLVLLDCSVSHIHTALASRYFSQTEVSRQEEIISVLRETGFVTQHTLIITLLCLDGGHSIRKVKAEELLNSLNVQKLKQYAMKVLLDENNKDAKSVLALRTLGYASRLELDEEVLELTVQFIDHYNLTYRLEALKSLHRILRSLINSETPVSEHTSRRILAATPHVLKDRLLLCKYEEELRCISVRCLAALWRVLDRGNSETGINEMSHILVEEQRFTSYLVGPLNVLLGFVSKFINSDSLHDQATGWKCLMTMNCFEYTSKHSRTVLFHWVQSCFANNNNLSRVLKVLHSSEPCEQASQLFAPLVLRHLRTLPVQLAAKLLYKWGLTRELEKHLQLPIEITEEASEALNTYREYLSSLSSLSSVLSTELPAYKSLVNHYKRAVNRIVECLKLGGNPELDISGDCNSFEDYKSAHKPSYDSAISESGEVPSARLCFSLLRAGVQSESLTQRVVSSLQGPESFEEFFFASKSWCLLGSGRFYSPVTESLLVHYIEAAPRQCTECVSLLSFQSDAVASRLISLLERPIRGLCSAISCSLELSTVCPLEELARVLNSGPSRRSHTRALKVLKKIRIQTERQLTVCVQAVSRVGCGVLVQTVWEYWLEQLSLNPGYVLPAESCALLEFCANHETSFLLRCARTLGLFPVESPPSEVTSAHAG